ncbi:hypothetical protein PTI98_008896 [Pleurotus ostreatus]|nr:hypothetical protein PTI98_008896 [Pleurotus ostreatus]
MTTQPPLVGLAAALASQPPTRTVFAQFSLVEKVAFVTGGGRGIGLEVAAAFAEAGAIVYCLGPSKQPHNDFVTVQEFVARMPPLAENVKNGKMEYISGDVTDQKQMWKIAEDIVAREGRLDICFANAGILAGADCLEYSAEDFTKIINVNVNGVLYTAQAAGRQMEKLGIPGSIILNASMAGSICIRNQKWVAYTTSKSAIIQMARSMACELGSKGIRVNSVSPGYIYTKMTKAFLDSHPDLMEEWCLQNPLGRLGRTDESRGVCLWLASDASTFCTGSE